MKHWQENTCGGAGLKLYKERESGAGIFLWFLRNFLRSPFLSRKFLGARSLIITWITSFLRFLFFWLTWCVFMGLLVHFAYVLVFLSSNNDHTNSFDWPSECFTHGSGKTIRIFNQVLTNMSWATKLKFSPTILQ